MRRPEVKLAATLAFVIAVVATPREAFWAFGAHAALVMAAAAAGRLPPGFLLRRLLIEVPFLLFALFLPFFGRGERIEVIGASLSLEGLWAAWNILAKATLGTAASVILAATTRVPDLLKAFARLHFPRVLTAMMGFMIRYLDVVIGELARMRTAAALPRLPAAPDRRGPGPGRRLRDAVRPFLREGGAGLPGHAGARLPGSDARARGGHRPGPPVGGSRGGRGPRRCGGGGGVGAAMSVPTIALSRVSFAYPDGRRALQGIDLHIHPGERVALLGPNGAGKTTLVLHLNGILLPQQGTVEVAGIPVTREHFVDVRRRVGLVFQDPDDQVFMPTVHEDVAFGPANLGLRGAESEERVAAALAAVGMQERRDRAPHHLSYGERRLVAIATVLAMRPEILVLDEPSANLDPAGRRELAGVLRRLGMTMLMVTHDLPYALQLCDRAVVLSAGRIVADGPIDAVLADGPLMAAHRLEWPLGFDLGLLGRLRREAEGRPPG